MISITVKIHIFAWKTIWNFNKTKYSRNVDLMLILDYCHIIIPELLSIEILQGYHTRENKKKVAKNSWFYSFTLTYLLLTPVLLTDRTALSLHIDRLLAVRRRTVDASAHGFPWSLWACAERARVDVDRLPDFYFGAIGSHTVFLDWIVRQNRAED